MSGWEEYKKTMVVGRSLWQAARENDVAAIESSLSEGSDIDARDPRGFSALMLAAYVGNAEAFDCLLAHGADPNSVDHAGNSILMGAACKGHVHFVKKLLGAGAARSATNAAGLDARAFALRFGRTDVLEIFDRF
jgi:uncharacterized protein